MGNIVPEAIHTVSGLDQIFGAVDDQWKGLDDQLKKPNLVPITLQMSGGALRDSIPQSPHATTMNATMRLEAKTGITETLTKRQEN